MSDRDVALRERGGLAVVGCGYQGRETHCATLHKLGLLTAVADLRRDAAESAGRRFGVPYFYGPDAAEDLLAASSYAGLVVSVGSDQHPAVAKAALQYTNVLVEKPFALTPGDATEMFAAAEQYGRVLDAHHPLNEILSGGSALARAVMRFGRMEAEWRRQAGQPQTVVASDPIPDLGSHLIYLHRGWLPAGRVPSELQARYGSYGAGGPDVPDRFRADIHYPAFTETAQPFALEGGHAQFTAPRTHEALDVTLLAVYISPALRAAGRFERVTFSAEGRNSGAYCRFATDAGRSRGALSLSIAGHSVRLPIEDGRLSIAEAQLPAIDHFLDLLVGRGVPYITASEAVLQATLLTKIKESASQNGALIRLESLAESA